MQTSILDQYTKVRQQSEKICSPLGNEDYVVQPIVDVSPPKWHLGHTTWFFETFLLKPFLKDYKEFDKNYNFVFNSYYETVGARVIRTDRGNLSRPSVSEVYDYRRHVDENMEKLLRGDLNKEILDSVILGLNHEQQHQELLYSDIKFILGHNPLFPPYSTNYHSLVSPLITSDYVKMPEGIYGIGHEGDGFCFDNECGRHKVYLEEYSISKSLVSNREYMDFINHGGYTDFTHWHSEGWEWVKVNGIKHPYIGI